MKTMPKTQLCHYCWRQWVLSHGKFLRMRNRRNLNIKTVPTILPLTLLALNCCGQGEVYFGNRGVLLGGDHYVYADFVGGTKLEGTNFVAELYYGPLGADVS